MNNKMTNIWKLSLLFVVLCVFFYQQERECTESDGWLEPGTLENIRKLMTEYMTQLCQKSKGRKGIMDASSGEPVEDIEEEVGTFLDTLMDDEDVETYDILGDEEF